MIAAAAAAMVGGAFATEYVYDYSASLKTTTGKAGSQTTTYTVNCGLTEDGTYWWDDLDLGFVDAKTAKKYVNKLSNEEKRDFAIDTLGYDEETGMTNYYVPEYYKGKAQWCFTFTYKVTETDCYRVATSIKVKDTVYVDDCCGEADWEFADGTVIDFDFGFRFGAVSFAKATKVEVLAKWENDYEGFAVAGQGTWADKLGKNDGVCVGGVKNISGNIVGWLANSECRNCCDYPKYARCFDFCEGEIYDSEDVPTAAFGTWSLKFNSKQSFK